MENSKLGRLHLKDRSGRQFWKNTKTGETKVIETNDGFQHKIDEEGRHVFTWCSSK